MGLWKYGLNVNETCLWVFRSTDEMRLLCGSLEIRIKCK